MRSVARGENMRAHTIGSTAWDDPGPAWQLWKEGAGRSCVLEVKWYLAHLSGETEARVRTGRAEAHGAVGPERGHTAPEGYPEVSTCC